MEVVNPPATVTDVAVRSGVMRQTAHRWLRRLSVVTRNRPLVANRSFVVVNARRGGFPEVRLPRRSQRALAVRVALLCMRGVRSPTTRHTMAPIAVAKKTA